jgi:hypothetical protein
MESHEEKLRARYASANTEQRAHIVESMQEKRLESQETDPNTVDLVEQLCNSSSQLPYFLASMVFISVIYVIFVFGIPVIDNVGVPVPPSDPRFDVITLHTTPHR